MSDVTHILSAIEQGDPHAAEQLLPLVYDELRKLAAQKLTQEKPGQTLEATALVHEAYLRLVGGQQFANRRHFFAAAAQAMRRVLVESARRKQIVPRVQFEGFEPLVKANDQRLLELHDALEQLAGTEPMAAKVVEVRVFAGLSMDEAAAALGLSRATAYREWTFARAWLATALADNSKKTETNPPRRSHIRCRIERGSNDASRITIAERTVSGCLASTARGTTRLAGEEVRPRDRVAPPCGDDARGA